MWAEHNHNTFDVFLALASMCPALTQKHTCADTLRKQFLTVQAMITTRYKTQMCLFRLKRVPHIATRKHINCNVTAKQRTCGCWASGNLLFLRVLQVLVLENRGAALISKHGPLPHVERWRLNPMWWSGDEHSWGRQCL